MARARNIKPAFFDNDELAENDPLGRLLFIGLWTVCDFNGNLEWRGKRIQKQILPYDSCDINKLAINLDKSGFVRFYSDGEKIYLNVLNFAKHQNPHKNERAKGSDIPTYSNDKRQLIDLKGLTINHDKSRLKPEDSASNPADSLIPYPDSLILIPDTDSPQVEESRFAEFWDLYGKKVDSKKCEAKFNKLTNKEIELLFGSLQGYINSTPEKQFRKNPLTWLNGKCWNDEVQKQPNKQGVNAIGEDFSAPEGWGT